MPAKNLCNSFAQVLPKGNALEIEGNVLNVSSEIFTISNDLVQKAEILKTIPVFSFDLYK